LTSACVITVILNTNRRDDTLATLESLAKSSYTNHKVILLDNASTDGSVETIRSQFPQVQIIKLEENLGYAGNNNVGISAAMDQGADWVFVLNEDTIVDPDCIGMMIDAAGDYPDAGILGPLVYHFNEPEVIQTAGGQIDPHWETHHLGQNQLDKGQFVGVREVDFISGCAILVKRQVIEQIGAIDHRFFYYWEETDWCMRARENNWKVYCVSQAHLWHKGVQRDYRPSANVTYYATRNRFLFLQNHRAPLGIWIAVWWQILRRLASWSIRPKWRHKREHRDALWQGIKDYLNQQWGIRTA
jgi:GT2 family glycosyltransferase